MIRLGIGEWLDWGEEGGGTLKYVGVKNEKVPNELFNL